MVNKASRKARCAGSRANDIWPNVEAQSFCLLLVAAQKNLDIDKLTETKNSKKTKFMADQKIWQDNKKLFFFGWSNSIQKLFGKDFDWQKRGRAKSVNHFFPVSQTDSTYWFNFNLKHLRLYQEEVMWIQTISCHLLLLRVNYCHFLPPLATPYHSLPLRVSLI